MKKYLPLFIGAFLLVLGVGIAAYPAIQSIVGLAVASSSTTWNNLKDVAAGDNLTNGVVAGGCYEFDGTNWDGCRGDITNGLDVDVTRMPAVVGATTPADNFTNPTTAIPTWSLNGELSGSTWYQVRNSFVQSTTGVATNAAGTTVTMTTTPMSKYTMIIDRTAGSTNVVEVDLQCSINNVAFIQIATITDLTNEPVLSSVTDVPCNYMRYNVVTVGSGNTLAIDLLATR